MSIPAHITPRAVATVLTTTGVHAASLRLDGTAGGTGSGYLADTLTGAFERYLPQIAPANTRLSVCQTGNKIESAAAAAAEGPPLSVCQTGNDAASAVTAQSALSVCQTGNESK